MPEAAFTPLEKLPPPKRPKRVRSIAEAAARPVGRPTLYSQQYVNEVKEFMAQGYSLTAFAGHIGTGIETVYGWERQIPEFSEAVKTARAKRVGNLELGLLREDMPGPAVTARIFALKNAAPAEWRDRIEHTGANGGPIQSVALTADLTRLDPEQRDQLRALLHAASAPKAE